jgi:hypothetical protein
MLLPSSEESGSGCVRLYRQVSRVDWLKVLGTKARKAWARLRQQIRPSTKTAGRLGLCPGREQTRLCSEPWGSEQGSLLASSHEGWVGPEESMSVWGGWVETEVTEHRLAISSDASPLCCCNDVVSVAKKSRHRDRPAYKGWGQESSSPGRKLARV